MKKIFLAFLSLSILSCKTTQDLKTNNEVLKDKKIDTIVDKLNLEEEFKDIKVSDEELLIKDVEIKNIPIVKNYSLPLVSIKKDITKSMYVQIKICQKDKCINDFSADYDFFLYPHEDLRLDNPIKLIFNLCLEKKHQKGNNNNCGPDFEYKDSKGSSAFFFPKSKNKVFYQEFVNLNKVELSIKNHVISFVKKISDFLDDEAYLASIEKTKEVSFDIVDLKNIAAIGGKNLASSELKKIKFELFKEYEKDKAISSNNNTSFSLAEAEGDTGSSSKSTSSKNSYFWLGAVLFSGGFWGGIYSGDIIQYKQITNTNTNVTQLNNKQNFTTTVSYKNIAKFSLAVSVVVAGLCLMFGNNLSSFEDKNIEELKSVFVDYNEKLQVLLDSYKDIHIDILERIKNQL